MNKTYLAALAAASLTGALTVPVHAQERVRVGVLRCEVSGGLGLIITSSKDIACRFNAAKGRSESYYGNIRKFGLDIGATQRGVLVWDVFAPTNGAQRHALAGNYEGVGASATVGAGLGANALIGGSDRSFALQPLSVQGQTGLALAAGVESLELRPGG